jgi:hypothetical protein
MFGPQGFEQPHDTTLGNRAAKHACGIGEAFTVV